MLTVDHNKTDLLLNFSEILLKFTSIWQSYSGSFFNIQSTLSTTG